MNGMGHGRFRRRTSKKSWRREVATFCERDELLSEKKMLKDIYVMWKTKQFLWELRFAKAVRNTL